MSLDSSLFLWINGVDAGPHWVSALALFATERLPLLMGGGALGVFVVGDRRVRLQVARVFAAMAIAWVIARLGQHFIPADRPFILGLGKQWVAHGASHAFPSTHASVAFAFALTTARAAGRWQWTLLAMAAALLMAWSRVYLGLHFPTDVLGGALAGVASGWLACRLPLHLDAQGATTCALTPAAPGN